jgi:hypothetical protein
LPWPTTTSIYKPTNEYSRYAITGQKTRATDTSVATPTDAASVRRSCATHSGSLPCVPLQIRAVDLQQTHNFNDHQLNMTDALTHTHRTRAHRDRCGIERVRSRLQPDRRVLCVANRRRPASVAPRSMKLLMLDLTDTDV